MAEYKKYTTKCSVEDCESPYHAKDFCVKHYYRFRRYGDPEFVKHVRGSRQSDGYPLINVNGKSMKEHRYIMEQMLGRPMFPGENVHHKNGIRHDNRPENLELWSTRQPKGQRIEDKVMYALEILNLYRSELLFEEEWW